VTTELNKPRSAQNFNRIKSLALLECHYLKHQCFIDENYILNTVDKIAHLPATIIHGRYDLVCKAEAAYSLHSSWPNSTLHIVPKAGHSASEPAIAGALVRATQQFADSSIIAET
jgi:proline iminopeptidase